MCGINGLWMYKGRRVDKRLQAMYEESLRYIDARGGHATGIYTSGKIIKMPLKAREFLRILRTIDRRYAIGSTEILGHTRFATVGSYNVNANNHPFETNNFVFAHNGSYFPITTVASNIVVDKYSGTVPETDSFELLANIQTYYDDGMNVPEAVETAINDGYGAYAFWLYHKDDDKLYLFREDNPLHIAQTKGFLAFASQSNQLPKKLQNRAFALKPKVLYEVDRSGNIRKHKLNIIDVPLYNGYAWDSCTYSDIHSNVKGIAKRKIGSTKIIRNKKTKLNAKELDALFVDLNELISKSAGNVFVYSEDSEKVALLITDDKTLDKVINLLEEYGAYYGVLYSTRDYTEIEIYKSVR